MKLGEWELWSIVAGRLRQDGGATFGVVPKVIWEKQLPADERNLVPIALRVMVARGNGRTVLIDVGAGPEHSEKYHEIYAFEETPTVIDLVAQAGIVPEEVTDVLLTHLHFDHAAGIVGRDGDGWRLLFPQARHHVQRSQWEHSLRPNSRDRSSYYQDRLAVMEREGALDLHDGEWTLADGFDLPVYNGHTPGLQLPRISGGGDTLFYASDLIPTHHHIPTPYVMAYDLNPALAMEEKVPVLERAHSENWILFFEHDAHLPACRLSREGKRFGVAEKVEMQGIE